MALVDQALRIAVEAHAGQTDRYGAPLILHVLRVMLRLTADDERAAAALHDVVEDTPLTLADLRAAGMPEPVVHAVDALTRREGEGYDVLISRAAADPIARRVKLADLEDNMDLRRMSVLGPEDAPRLERYRAAWHRLRGAP